MIPKFREDFMWWCFRQTVVQGIHVEGATSDPSAVEQKDIDQLRVGMKVVSKLENHCGEGGWLCTHLVVL